MYDHSFHRGRKRLRHYCLQAFSTEEILKSYIKDYFKTNGKERIMNMVNMIHSKIMKEK